MKRQGIHRGAGDGTPNTAFGIARTISISAAETGGAFGVFRETVEEGQGPPLHIHWREHELFTVLSGRVRFVCGEDEFTAGEGDLVMIPPGLQHTFVGVEPAGSVVQVILTPGRGADFFGETEGLNPAEDKARVEEIAAAYDLEFVGPPLR
ncbi:cupin domain-containing protein [Pontivivens ytuae]|uniref:Cupin domain-containing protein n=1 Tax=Pontivivens ytuae TaxID=2789856 RepID=A0A7S9QD68_9RHOB|nr:cupin domain-containing protein [Pontivivens ytuae]QPH53826.1 cupin domain-containing protein [Pontivivens ytuae]